MVHMPAPGDFKYLYLTTFLIFKSSRNAALRIWEQHSHPRQGSWSCKNNSGSKRDGGEKDEKRNSSKIRSKQRGWEFLSQPTEGRREEQEIKKTLCTDSREEGCASQNWFRDRVYLGSKTRTLTGLGVRFGKDEMHSKLGEHLETMLLAQKVMPLKMICKHTFLDRGTISLQWNFMWVFDHYS